MRSCMKKNRGTSSIIKSLPNGNKLIGSPSLPTITRSGRSRVGLEVSGLWLGDKVISLLDVVGFEVIGDKLGRLDGLDVTGDSLGDTVGSNVVGLDVMGLKLGVLVGYARQGRK